MRYRCVMQGSTWKTCRWVAGTHVALLLLFGAVALVRPWFQAEAELIIPVEFMVDVRPLETAVAIAEPVPEPVAVPEPPAVPVPEPVPDPIPDPAPVPVTEPEPPRPRRPPIEPSRQRVIRVTGAEAPPTPTLSPAEIERLLAEGARPSDRTVVPGEDQRMMARIRDLLHAAWVEPSAAEAGGREAVLTLTLDASGRIVSGGVTKASGSEPLDASVRDVLARVREIPGVSADFVRRYPQIHVAFQVRN